ncbi:MAG: S41 family peptidase [Chitinophaga sp.]|uniref:S41 family peptidase n=1 Tax=Chitinophaga sp. TaxID=1869181 RepID=UPI0025B82BA7|nr:S41 family peptidase [Chitinophaga sp.]MBV8256048.1 S41 family peptidase [Chitinophaga sp.]
MRKLLSCALLLMCTTALHAQKTLFDSVFTMVKERSIFSQSANWDSIAPKVYQRYHATASDSVEAIFPAFGLLLKELKDMHSGMSYKGQGYGNPDAYAFVRSKISKEMKDAYKKGYGELRTTVLDGRYGYITIPETSITPSEDMQAAFRDITVFAQHLSDSLWMLQSKPLKGIIIDLRLNGGGSTPAMIGGIASLFADGVCFTFSKLGNIKEEMIFKNGNLFYDTMQITRLNEYSVSPRKVKVAVLISGFTASAGEHTAIALKAIKNTRFFGSPTRGQITGNETIFLRKDLTLSLSSAWAEDGVGKRYMVDVVPDEVITDGADFEHLNNDKSVQAAIKWFGSRK